MTAQRANARVANGLVVAVVIALAVLAGCAGLPKGVKASPEDLEACAREACSVWTESELLTVYKRGYLQGFIAGRSKGS